MAILGLRVELGTLNRLCQLNSNLEKREQSERSRSEKWWVVGCGGALAESVVLVDPE